MYVKHLRLPKSAIPTFALIKKLESNQRDDIIKILQSVDPDSIKLSKNIILKISKAIDDTVKNVKILIDVIYEIIYQQYDDEFERNVEEFLHELKKAIIKAQKMEDEEEICPEEDEWDDYLKFWERILNLDKNIGLLAKARFLKIDYSLLFKDSKIYTDIRPIFPRDLSIENTGAIIKHMLKIVYYSVDELNLRSIFLSLEIKDLKQLKIMIERAVMKEEKLKELFINRKLNLIYDNKLSED